jgi:hypothetical protein
MQQKLSKTVGLIGPFSRLVAVLMILGGSVLGQYQDDRTTLLFRVIEPLVFAAIGIVLLCGVVILILSRIIRCEGCGRVGTILGPLRPEDIPPMSLREKWAAFFWPTQAGLRTLRCSKCGHPFLPSTAQARHEP